MTSSVKQNVQMYNTSNSSVYVPTAVDIEVP